MIGDVRQHEQLPRPVNLVRRGNPGDTALGQAFSKGAHDAHRGAEDSRALAWGMAGALLMRAFL